METRESAKLLSRGFDSRSGLTKMRFSYAMKKTVLLIAIAIVLSTKYFVPSTVWAQTFDFNKAYQDYIYTLSVYDQSFSDYEDARDFYKKDKTLTLKEEARKKTLTMLRNRDELERVYLTALRLKIVELKGLKDEEKVNIFAKIDSEAAWYQSHKENYKDGDSLEDLFNKSDEATDRYKNTTQQIIYEALFTVSLGEVTGLRSDHERMYSDLRGIIDTGVNEGKLDINPFNRWFTDIENVISELKDNEQKAKDQIQKIYGQTYSPKSSYDTAIATLSSSVTLLKQLNNFLIEVVNSIKNQLQ